MSFVVENAGEEKPVRWQKGIKFLKSGIEHIYKTKEFADVQFVVGARTFKAHKLVLAARSSEFMKILLKAQADTSLTSREIVKDVSEDGFETLLCHIYTDKVGDLDKDQLLQAHRAAAKFNQKGLLKVCEDRIAEWEISCDNVCALLNQLSDIESMKLRCLRYLKNNALSVLTSDGLKHASPHTLWLMFEGGYFKHAPPKTRLENVVRWAMDQLTDQTDFSLCRELLLEETKPFLGRCGIEKLDNKDLATAIQKYKNLLTPQECTVFLVNAQLPGSMPYPEWLVPDGN